MTAHNTPPAAVPDERLTADYVLPAAMQKWVRQYDWAYSTTAECYGHEPSENDVYNWCVFDADEDDPPLFEGATVDDAQMLVYVMRWLQQRLIDGLDVSE